MKARHLVLLAFGSGKAEAIAETVEGGVSSFCPASALQLHPHVTVIVDERPRRNCATRTITATHTRTSRRGRASERVQARTRTTQHSRI